MKNYGRELIMDLHNCDKSKFNRRELKKYFTGLCEVIDMKAEKLCWWDDYGLPEELCQKEAHTKGTSAVQFILTSNITVHTLDLLGNVYVNIFSCKYFDERKAEYFTVEFFSGLVKQSLIIERK